MPVPCNTPVNVVTPWMSPDTVRGTRHHGAPPSPTTPVGVAFPILSRVLVVPVGAGCQDAPVPLLTNTLLLVIVASPVPPHGPQA
jgi:hypothetical protein